MKLISLFCILALYFCTCKHVKKKANIDTTELLKLTSAASKSEDSLLGNLVSDSFRKWFPIWDTVYVNDCKYRRGNVTYLDYADEQNKLDSINLKIVAVFLDKYGYPGKYQASTVGKNAILMVMQHAPIATQEKYYPMWFDAYKKNNITGGFIMLLEDRINMYRNRKQYYGTQHIKFENGEDYLYPVVNPDSINAWRKQMGMDETIEKEYKELYNSKWDIVKYKKELPGLIKKFKVTDSPSIRFIKQP